MTWWVKIWYHATGDKSAYFHAHPEANPGLTIDRPNALVTMAEYVIVLLVTVY